MTLAAGTREWHEHVRRQEVAVDDGEGLIGDLGPELVRIDVLTARVRAEAGACDPCERTAMSATSRVMG